MNACQQPLPLSPKQKTSKIFPRNTRNSMDISYHFINIFILLRDFFERCLSRIQVSDSGGINSRQDVPLS
jgi:hypothetical protein